MTDPYLALQVLMMPKDANGLPPVPGGPPSTYQLTIFGGVLLSYIDQAGAIGAIHEVTRAGGVPPSVVTVAINRVEFKQPVFVGDVVRFLTRVMKIGADLDHDPGPRRGRARTRVLRVTEAELVYVGIDLTTPDRRPKPLLPDEPEA